MEHTPETSQKAPQKARRNHDSRWGCKIPDPADLRRHSFGGSLAARRCVELACYLPPSERTAVLAVYRDGMTVKDLAALQGEKRDPRYLRRTLRRIALRMLAPKFEFVGSILEPGDQLARRGRGMPCWPPLRRAVAEQCIVRGRSIHRASIILRVSHYAVRREMTMIHALFCAQGGSQ